MVTKPARIRAVYEELRHFFGPKYSSGELLRYAAELVEFVELESLVEAEFVKSEDANVLGPSLDVAFTDGGWRLLFREFPWIDNMYEDHPFVPNSRRRKRYPIMERSLFPEVSGRYLDGWKLKTGNLIDEE